MNHEQITVDIKPTLVLPCKESPIRFAVQQRNGLTSNAWGVKVEDTGDAYIYCRDSLQGQKISLHASGKQHIAFPESMRAKINMPTRFMNQWNEPRYEKEAIATLKLLFPSGWSIGLNEDQRANSQSIWAKNDIWINGHDELMTVVSFVIVDDGVMIRQKEGSYPIGIIGDLRLRSGKRLCVIAGWEPEGDWKATAEDALGHIDASRFTAEEDRGQDIVICLTGNYSPDSAFMVVVPVELGPRQSHSRGIELNSGDETDQVCSRVDEVLKALPILTNPSPEAFFETEQPLVRGNPKHLRSSD